MRLKNVPGAREFVSANPYVIEDTSSTAGHWNEIFGNRNPIHIEIGTGKGRFLMDLAALHPEINYVGIEMYSSVLMRALQKQNELQLPNLRFLCVDARKLLDIFAPGEVGRIYLNFSDPWPKDRHAKRRLTSNRFLPMYAVVLEKGGRLEFKTDNRPLFDFSVESVNEQHWTMLLCTYDLHHSPYMDGNIMTEYEEKFSSQGNPICKLAAMPPETHK